jgi:hypothetical protein
MLYEIVIETHRDFDGTYRADVTEGPSWAEAEGCTANHNTARAAFAASRQYVQHSRRRPLKDTFEFLHIES